MTITFLQTILFVGENALRWIYEWEFRLPKMQGTINTKWVGEYYLATRHHLFEITGFSLLEAWYSTSSKTMVNIVISNLEGTRVLFLLCDHKLQTLYYFINKS